jgi:hypothetical protein
VAVNAGVIHVFTGSERTAPDHRGARHWHVENVVRSHAGRPAVRRVPLDIRARGRRRKTRLDLAAAVPGAGRDRGLARRQRFRGKRCARCARAPGRRVGLRGPRPGCRCLTEQARPGGPPPMRGHPSTGDGLQAGSGGRCAALSDQSTNAIAAEENGSSRSRRPVAAKIAFASAGAVPGTDSSPSPPGSAWLSTKTTSIGGT